MLSVAAKFNKVTVYGILSKLIDKKVPFVVFHLFLVLLEFHLT